MGEATSWKVGSRDGENKGGQMEERKNSGLANAIQQQATGVGLGFQASAELSALVTVRPVVFDTTDAVTGSPNRRRQLDPLAT